MSEIWVKNNVISLLGMLLVFFGLPISQSYENIGTTIQALNHRPTENFSWAQHDFLEMLIMLVDQHVLSGEGGWPMLSCNIVAIYSSSLQKKH